MKTWVILNDIQFPFHDAQVLNKLVLPFIDDLQPDGVILNGDIVDCYSISTFDKNPLTKAGLTLEIKLAQALMGRLAKIPTKVWIGGNHEDRLRRLVWKNPYLLGSVDSKTREKLVQVLDFPEMFGLGEHGFEWLPYGGRYMLGKLMVTHGSMVRTHSGDTARAHLLKYGTSVLVGHTHRGGTTYKTDARGVHVGYENYCLCSLQPEYAQDPNWQQGFAVVHVFPNGYFNVQSIPIINRRSFFFGDRQIVRAAA